MEKVNLLSRAEMKKVTGGVVGTGGRCISSSEDVFCSFEGDNRIVYGECGYSINREQCRCIAWDDSASVPDINCIAPGEVD